MCLITDPWLEGCGDLIVDLALKYHLSILLSCFWGLDLNIESDAYLYRCW